MDSSAPPHPGVRSCGRAIVASGAVVNDNETSADPRQDEFDSVLRLAILDALAGRLRHEMLARLAATHENDTVRFCLRRLADPSLDAAEESLLVGLLMRSRQVQGVLARLSELAAGSAVAFGILFRE